MNNPPYFPVVSYKNRSAFKIALLYLLIGSLWILFSDQLAAKIAPDQGTLTLISIYKGWGYVVVTALILYWLIGRDNTRRKQAEKRLHDSEQNYQVLLDQASDGIFIADAQGQYTLVNEEACRLLGYTKEELLSMNFRELIAPEDLLINPPHLDELHNGKTLITERILLRKDGSRILCEISAKLLADGRYQSIIRDITERKATEDALKRSEKRYRSLFKNMTNGFARCQMLYDEDGNSKDFIYLDVNEAFENLTGLGNVLGKRVSEVIPGIRESNPEVFEIYGRVAMTGEPEKFETYVPDLGAGIWFSVSAYSSEKGFFVAVFEIITERKRAEASLRRSYKQLLSFIEHAPLSIAMFDLDMNYLATSRRWILDYGRGHTDLIGHNHYDIHPDVPDYWREAHQKGLAGESLKNDDDLWIQADGTKNWLRWALTPWTDEHGKVGGVIISTEDISERKRAEAAAFKSELRYQRILDALMEGCQIIDSDWRYIYVNETVVQQGKRKPEEMLNHTMMEIYPGIEQTEMFSALRQCVEDRRPKRMENQFVFPDGSIEWFELSIQPAEEGLFILSTDITERKRAEEALRESEERLRLSLHAANQGLYDLNVQTGDAVVNREYAEMLGYDPDSFVETNAAWIERLHPDDREITAKAYTNYINNLTPEYRVEFRQRIKDGGWKWILSLGKVVEYDVDGKPLRMLGTHTDITERKQVEEKLHDSEEQYRLMFTNNPLPMFVFDRETFAFLAVNDATVAYYGYSREEFMKMTIKDIRPPEDIPDMLKIVATKSEPYFNIGIVRHRKKDGILMDVEITRHDILFDGREALIILANDVTARKRAEEALRNAHDELELQVQLRTQALAQANTLLETLLEYTPDQIYFKDAESRFIRNSRAQTVALGLNDSSQVIGKTDFDFFPHAQRAYDEEQEIIRSGKPLVDFEEHVIWPDNKETWISTTKIPLRDQTGQIIGTFGISRDITERKRNEYALRKAKEELELKVAERTTELKEANEQLQLELGERKQVEEKLSESEERYRRFFENMHETFIIQEVVVDDSGKPIDLRYLDVNPAAERFMGKTQSEIVGKTRSQLAGRLDSEGVEMASQVASTGTPFHWVRYSPGFGGWFESFTYSLGSRIVATLSLDITERKHAEEALRESEARLNGIIASAMDAIISVDTEQTVVLFNAAAEKMFGCLASEAMGRPLERFIPERFRAAHRQHIRTFGETGVTNRAMNALGVIFGLRANGEEFPIEASISQIEIDGKKLYTVILRDITERKRAEEALRRSQENFVKAFNSNPAAIAITRLVDGKFLDLNPAYTRIMEYEPHELLDHTAAEMNIYVHPEERDQIVQQLREHGTVQNYALSVRIKSGGIRNIVISMEPILYNEQECILSVFIDISERQKMETELRRSNAELEQFAYVASHDLQEPLRAVAGMVQLLQQRYKGQLDERADEYIGYAVDASSRMQNLINDLLEYSRVDSLGKPFSETNLEKTLDLALANLQLSIQDSNALITHDPLPKLMVDAGQMAQVFQNLIGNAIKFRGERPPHIQVSAERLENDWRFSVRDNGIGIEPQYFERIFLVFQRLHSRREYSGTGIGLALCKKIIERHGGQIWVESQPGQGSTFYFTIPTR